MESSLRQIFSKTVQQFQEREFQDLEAEFLRDFKFPQDAGYFPMMLKQKKISETTVQVADFEYLRWQVTQAEEWNLRRAGPYALNSTLQWLVLESGAAVLKKPQGLYALWKFEGQVFEQTLSAEEAEKIQEIQEHPDLIPLNPECPVLNQLIGRGLIKQTSSGS